MLERYDLAKMGKLSAAAQHLIIEAQRRAYLDRARFLGDMDFTPVPIKRLTSKAHATELAATIDPARASSSADLGKDLVTVAESPESHETTHFSVVDKTGMAVSNTFTLEGGYGSHIVVSGAGFILNNEMGDFNKKPGFTDTTGNIGTLPNQIAPGKRMLSSMSPAIVTRNGKLFLVTPGVARSSIRSSASYSTRSTLEWISGRRLMRLARIRNGCRTSRAMNATLCRTRSSEYLRAWGIGFESPTANRATRIRSCTTPRRRPRTERTIYGARTRKSRRPRSIRTSE